MSLIKIDEQGRKFEVCNLPKNFPGEDIKGMIFKMTDGQRNEVVDYIKNVIDVVTSFSVATHLNRWGDTPLMFIYEAAGKNEKVAATVLGCMVYAVTVESKTLWCCMKSNITGREFDINFYWKV